MLDHAKASPERPNADDELERQLSLAAFRPNLRPRLPIPGLPRRIHLLGAGGAGVSGAARILVDHGHVLSGHDRSESEHVALLRRLGLDITVGPQSAARLPPDAELVIRSAAVPEEDGAVRDAQERGLAVLKYSEALGRITPADRTLAVAGTHGKTTSSWMVLHALRGLACASGSPHPGAIVGGVCRSLGVNAVTQEPGGWFAVEACEYDRSFLHLSPRGAIVTNVEADHLDYYGTLEAIHGAFARFVDRIPHAGLLVVGRDTPRSLEQSARCATWRLGRDLKVDLLGHRAGTFSFRLAGPGFVVPHVSLRVPGQFNVDNAACAIALVVGLAGHEGHVEPDLAARAAARGLERFQGSQRRFEPWLPPHDLAPAASWSGLDVVHDYAHHPTEVRVTLEAARRVFPARALHVLFQPHQHSRTARFLDEFVESLRMADRVVVADVYGARAHIDGEHLAGSQELASRLAAIGVDAVAGGDPRASARALAQGLGGEAAVLVLGAGDIVDVHHDLFAELALRRAAGRAAVR